MRWFLIGGVLLLAGGFIGFHLSGKVTVEVVELTREPTKEEIIKHLEAQEAEYLDEYDEIGQMALEGDVSSTWKMYNRYTYAERDYERSYFWAVILERQGYDSAAKGSYIEGAEGNIKAEFWSRTRDPSLGAGGSALPQDLLPEPE